MRFLFLVLMVMPSLASALTILPGGSDGGGGSGVVCYEKQNSEKIVSVELLDIFEGKQLENLNIHDIHDSNYMGILRNVLKKFDSPYSMAIQLTGERLNAGFKFLKKGIRLKPIDDSNEIFIPGNCRVEQLVNFQGPARIFVVSDFWDLLPDSQKAALVLHETLWYFERSSGIKNSAHARRDVARFFAEDYILNPVKYNPKESDHECIAVGDQNEVDLFNTMFTLKKIENDECEMNFQTIGGSIVFSRSTALLENCQNFLSPKDDGFSFIQTMDVYTNLPDGSQSGTHRISVALISKDIPNGYSYSRTIAIRNLEFSGMNQAEIKFECR